jgi:phospholipid/cholesterol/gamma-HCH transport system permease protein
MSFLLRPLEWLGESITIFFTWVGSYTILLGRFISSLQFPKLYYRQTINQMIRIGIQSFPIVALVAAFIGMVISIQAAYNFGVWTPLYYVGSVVGKSVLMETAPVITALVLTGRVGATISAELGTMRITEQIDALETLAFDPIGYLVTPRIIAGIVMFPILTIFADFIAIIGGWIAALQITEVTTYAFVKGLRLWFTTYDVTFGIIKSVFFGFAITSVSCLQGFKAKGGAEGVGHASMSAVVISCAYIIIIDYILASLLL